MAPERGILMRSGEAFQSSGREAISQQLAARHHRDAAEGMVKNR